MNQSKISYEGIHLSLGDFQDLITILKDQVDESEFIEVLPEVNEILFFGKFPKIMRIYTENKLLNKLKEFDMPKTWVQKFYMVLNPNVVRLYDIDLDSEEAHTAASKELYRIKVMKRIQNPSLWKRYMDEKKRLLQKYYGQTINEIQGFHGTKNTPPSVILNDIEGFDTARANNHCLYGKGIYFAKQAQYSLNNYAYKEFDNTKTVFLASVLIGNAFDA